MDNVASGWNAWKSTNIFVPDGETYGVTVVSGDLDFCRPILECQGQSRTKSGVSSKHNACHFLQLTTHNQFFCNKKCRILMFCNNSHQNGVILHNYNKNATLNKNAGFTESQKRRQRERAEEREREIQPESQRERQRKSQRFPLSLSLFLFGSL